jgi:methionyl-tRNA formyltransferase
VFLGSGGFAVPILDAIAAFPQVELVGVVTTAPRPAGRAGELRPTPVARRADELGVPLLLPERLRDLAALAIAALRPDLLVLADYGKIVPAALLGWRPWRAEPASVAAAASPGRDAAHPAAIAAGDASTGVSLIRMDTGTIRGLSSRNGRCRSGTRTRLAGGATADTRRGCSSICCPDGSMGRCPRSRSRARARR